MKFIRNNVQLAPESKFLSETNKTAKWIVQCDPDGRHVHAGPGVVIISISIISIIYIVLQIFIFQQNLGRRCTL